MTLRLFFMRHGETEWSLSGQYSGRADIPLTEHGADEARQLGKRIRSIPIGLSVEHAQHFLLNTASLSVLCYEHDRTDEPAIALWNSAAIERPGA